jgi:hypothetical protein
MHLMTQPAPGQVIEIHGHHLGEKGITGEILEVLGAPDHLHFRVRWEDGRETIYFPSNDAIVRPARGAPSGKGAGRV